MELMILGIMLSSVTYCIIIFLFSKEGTKGITEPYVTKSGIQHTAKKSRKDYIV